MRRVLIIVLLFILATVASNAQSKQKQMLKQITALKIYIGYAKKGYDIANKGINTVRHIKNSEFNLHRDFFNSLKNVNPLPRFVALNLFSENWVVCAKRPFGGLVQVIEYLGRYTHKVAISNGRIKTVTNSEVTFTYKDYKAAGITKQITLADTEDTSY